MSSIHITVSTTQCIRVSAPRVPPPQFLTALLPVPATSSFRVPNIEGREEKKILTPRDSRRRRRCVTTNNKLTMKQAPRQGDGAQEGIFRIFKYLVLIFFLEVSAGCLSA